MARMMNCTSFIINEAINAALESGEKLTSLLVRREFDKFLEARGASLRSDQVSDIASNLDTLGFDLNAVQVNVDAVVYRTGCSKREALSELIENDGSVQTSIRCINNVRS